MYEKYVEMKPLDFSGILTEGGTILGSSRQPFKNMRKPDANGMDKVAAMVNTYHKLKLDCLVILGGNGTQKSANMLREEGLNVVGLPKTIDNDIWGTDMTFGFRRLIVFTRQRIRTEEYLSWKLWDIKLDGLHFMPGLPGEQM